MKARALFAVGAMAITGLGGAAATVASAPSASAMCIRQLGCTGNKFFRNDPQGHCLVIDGGRWLRCRYGSRTELHQAPAGHHFERRAFTVWIVPGAPYQAPLPKRAPRLLLGVPIELLEGAPLGLF